VDGKIVAKVTDFGMSRRNVSDEDYYLAQANSPIPIRWAAPECFLRSKYSSASDIWSFGVLCWEVKLYIIEF
jgi:serine/threonine protein kinase